MSALTILRAASRDVANERYAEVMEAIDALAELHAAVPRAIQMLHVAAARSISFAADQITHYDDADCDGHCVHGDCIAALVELQAALTRCGVPA